MCSVFTVRYVDDAGDATTVVVVAVEISVFVRPGVVDPIARSRNDACVSTVTAADVTTRISSDVEARSSTVQGSVPEMVRSRSPIAMVSVSPAVSALLEGRSSLPRNVPPELAVQNETWVIVSVVDTFVQVMAAVFEMAPDAAAEPNVTACLVVSVAAFVVPADPGDPVCSFT